jgi:hypothetical protein
LIMNADEKKDMKDAKAHWELQQGPMPRDWCLGAENVWFIKERTV